MVRVKSKAGGSLVDVCTDDGYPIKATAINIEWVAGLGLVATLECPVRSLDMGILDKNTKIKVTEE